MEISKMKKCPECGDARLIHNKDKGEVVCLLQNSGFVCTFFITENEHAVSLVMSTIKDGHCYYLLNSSLSDIEPLVNVTPKSMYRMTSSNQNITEKNCTVHTLKKCPMSSMSSLAMVIFCHF